MNLTVSTALGHEGIVYLLELDVQGKRVVKVGITTRRIEDRVCEILTSYFKIHRYFPYCRPKRYRKTDNIYEKEQKILKHFKEYKYVPEVQFQGSSELLDVPLDVVVDIYEKVLKDQDIGDAYENDGIQ